MSTGPISSGRPAGGARPRRFRLWPRSLAGQLMVLLLLALIAAQAVGFVIFAGERRYAILAARQEQVLQRTASVVHVLENAPDHLDPKMRDAILGAATSARLRFWIADTGAVPADEPDYRDNRFTRRLRNLMGGAPDRLVLIAVQQADGRPFAPERAIWRHFHHRRDDDHKDDRDKDDHHDDKDKHDGKDKRDDGAIGHMRPMGPDHGGWRDRLREDPDDRAFAGPLSLRLAVRLSDGRWLNGAMAVPPAARWALPALVVMALMAAAICVITLLVVRRLTRPLARLASAADAFGRGQDSPDLSVEGPEEVRRTTAAFNQMRDRLSRFVGDRTRMLAAISHDLRTPLTSLRLRAEFIDDEENRRKILETLEEMERMTEAALAFARAEATAEPGRSTDLAALVESIAADLADLGKDVTMTDPGGDAGRATLTCRPLALKRALRNLIENAVAYGQRARVTVDADTREARVIIDDDGPGIPENMRAQVFEPFFRLEESRSRETGGVGLGMAIARTIVRGHGGDVTLENRAAGGLRVVVALPRGESAG